MKPRAPVTARSSIHLLNGFKEGAFLGNKRRRYRVVLCIEIKGHTLSALVLQSQPPPQPLYFVPVQSLYSEVKGVEGTMRIIHHQRVRGNIVQPPLRLFLRHSRVYVSHVVLQIAYGPWCE